MPTSSGSALALAARLRTLDDETLAALIRARGVREQGVRDFFDLAEALLDRASIQSALETLERPTLAALAVAGELATTSRAPTRAQLAERLGVDLDELDARLAPALEAGLVGSDSDRIAPWDAVVDQLTAWPSFGLPSAVQLETTPPPAALEPVSEADARFVDRGAGERAFLTVGAVAELLRSLEEEPARRLSRGGLALPDARRIGAAADVEPELVEILLDLAARAEIVTEDPSGWRVADAAAGWLAAPRLERWAALASGWIDRLSPEVLELLRGRAHAVWGDGLADYFAWLYPAGGEWIRGRIARAITRAELIGLVGSSTPSTPGAALLERGIDAAREAMRELFPPEVDGVYLQHDLTVIAPGPLAGPLDARMREIAEPGPPAVASSYRITAPRITRALASGQTAASVHGFLEEVALGGVPQPVTYLVDDTATRFGSLRVGALPARDAAGDRSWITAADPRVLEQLRVDHALAPIALHPVDGALRSRFEPEIVYGALVDARYAVVMEDSEGRLVVPARERPAAAVGEVAQDTAVILVDRVRQGSSAQEPDDDRAWLVRQLELAVKNRMTVVATVQLPDGSTADYQLEPTGLGGGRLRARDRRADIERTLPLSSITHVEPV
ncbi:MAG: helicase-associated domain-containing protein [Actinomycetales bacterium]|nr:helicase-associated domain-containing protein [Actinomycetales bacterium]